MPWQTHWIKYLLSKLFSSSATGLRVNFSFLCPSGLPKWEHNTTERAPFSNANLIEGKAATILALFVMTPVILSWGTLKSHLFNGTETFKSVSDTWHSQRNFKIQTYRIKTRFPAKSNFWMDNLFSAIFNTVKKLRPVKWYMYCKWFLWCLCL